MKRLFCLILCFSFFQLAKASPGFSPTDQIHINLNTIPPTGTRPGDTTKVQVSVIAPQIFDQNAIMQGRLDSIKGDFALTYNEYVQTYIDLYSRHHDEMAKVIGLTQYYFPIYEKAFCEMGIPIEIKYLSIVESKLDPNAVSRVGATGPWQFMFKTGKDYGLNVDKFVDDRRDPIQASYAAAAYLRDSFNEFGDWLLAIASYNCGTSNVERAIRKSGGARDFWSIRQFLPKETRNYVPAFIAITYVMNYFDKQSITPQACSVSLKTDTVFVNKFISLAAISQVLNVDVKELALLNPSYKKQIINGTYATPRRLIIPQVDNVKYSAFYDVLNNSSDDDKKNQERLAASANKDVIKIPSYHKVRKGETLDEIAETYGLELKQLRAWNHLHTNKVVPGKKIKLSEIIEEVFVKHHTSSNFITYKVKSGDTLSGIAAKFDGASVEKIKTTNGLKKDRLQAGMTIRISRG
jgi:membrane-bound lytic murein transglycosylase D